MPRGLRLNFDGSETFANTFTLRFRDILTYYVSTEQSELSSREYAELSNARFSLTNDFYKLLLDEKWHERNWSGPRQFQDDSTKTLMMLPTDMALVEDNDFKPYVEKYAADIDEFFDDFSKVLTKLLELGVPFTTGEDARIEFKRTE